MLQKAMVTLAAVPSQLPDLRKLLQLLLSCLYLRAGRKGKILFLKGNKEVGRITSSHSELPIRLGIVIISGYSCTYLELKSSIKK